MKQVVVADNIDAAVLNCDALQLANAAGSHPQESLIRFINAKFAQAAVEHKEMNDTLNLAIKNKWRTQPLRNAAGRMRKTVEYYRKVKVALEAGYVVMPPVSCGVFAVRVNDDVRLPAVGYKPSSWEHPGRRLDDLASQTLPVGEGEYVSPTFIFEHQDTKLKDNDGKEYIQREEWGTDTISEIPFPLIMCKPEMMEAAQKAMTLKIFDEIAVSPDTKRRKGDPILIGKIKKVGRFKEPLHFMIGWLVRQEDLLA